MRRNKIAKQKKKSERVKELSFIKGFSKLFFITMYEFNIISKKLLYQIFNQSINCLQTSRLKKITQGTFSMIFIYLAFHVCQLCIQKQVNIHLKYTCNVEN